MKLRSLSEGSMLGGSVAFDPSRIVCSTKKSFIKGVLSASSVWTTSSSQSGGIDVVLFGLIKCLSVFHQPCGPVSLFLSFAANLSITDCFALRISAVVMFQVCLYFSKSSGRFVFLYLLYKRLRFLIIFFISHVSQGGSDLHISIVLFGMCCFASAVIRSIIFFAYASISLSFKSSKLVS